MSAAAPDVAPAQLLTEHEVAVILRLRSKETLRKWRQRGIGPAYVKLGAGGVGATVRYRPCDVDAWIQSRRIAEGGDA